MMRSSSEMSRHLGEKFGAPDHGEHPSWRYWLQQKTGILRFRMHIAASKFESDYSCLAAKELVELLKFEIFVGVLILGNAAQMFFAAMYKPGEVVPPVIALSEHLFVFVFLLEWVLRILGHGWVWMFWSKMNIFDTCIVWVTGVLVTWMLPPLGVDATILRRLSALRVLRLGRIIRAIRSMPQFRELWTFVHGMLTCMYLVFWAGLIIFGVHYMFGIFIMETITKSATFKDDEFVQAHMGSMGDAMFTLFQIMTFDSWNIIVRAIITKMPEAMPLFALFIGVAGIVLFNLMTAIIIQNALVDAPKRDAEALALRKDMENRKWDTSLRNMFFDLDEDGTGTLDAQEFEAVLVDVNFARMMKVLDVDLEELPDIFDILNDGSGEISVEAFITGLMRMQGPAMSRDMLKSTKRLSLAAGNFKKLREELTTKAIEPLDRTMNDLEVVHEDFTKMQLLIKQHIEHLNNIGIRRTFKATRGELVRVKEPSLKEVQKSDRKDLKEKRSNKAQAAKGDGLKQLCLDVPGSQFKRLPAAWVWQRMQDEKERKAQEAAEGVEKQKKGLKDKATDELEHPGINTEFASAWKEFQLDVPDVRAMSLEQVIAHVESGAFTKFGATKAWAPKAFLVPELAMAEQATPALLGAAQLAPGNAPAAAGIPADPSAGSVATTDATAPGTAPVAAPAPAAAAQPAPAAPAGGEQPAATQEGSTADKPTTAEQAAAATAGAAAQRASTPAPAAPQASPSSQPAQPRPVKVVQGLPSSLVVPTAPGVFLPPVVEEPEDPDSPPSHQLVQLHEMDLRELPNLPHAVEVAVDEDYDSDDR
mmetsp:Transcript_92734/g.298115  ORF Transcript_92734/g.298115 Transcript_92734/m.298115 type:complete len:817 (+) Transcript_92734:333-2783(+)